MNKIIKSAGIGICGIILTSCSAQPIPAVTFDQIDSYTVALVHRNNLPVYANPDIKSEIYTRVNKGQEIECVNYENDWLTIVFKNGFYGFIDAYEAELIHYYPSLEEEYCE